MARFSIQSRLKWYINCKVLLIFSWGHGVWSSWDRICRKKLIVSRSPRPLRAGPTNPRCILDQHTLSPIKARSLPICPFFQSWRERGLIGSLVWTGLKSDNILSIRVNFNKSLTDVLVKILHVQTSIYHLQAQLFNHLVNNGYTRRHPPLLPMIILMIFTNPISRDLR